MDNNSQNFDLRELFYIFKSNYIIYIYAFLISFVSLSIFYLSALPQYTSNAKIYIEDDASTINPFAEISGRRDLNMINNQMEILNSRVLRENTIKNLAESSRKDNLYLFNTRNENDDLNNLVKQGLRKILLSEIFSYNTFEEAKQDNPQILSIAEIHLKNNLIFSSGRNSDIINITYSSNNSIESALVINALLVEYQKMDIMWQNNEHRFLQSFLNDQLEIKIVELQEIENTLKDFQESNKIFGLDNDTEIILSNVQSMESDLYQTKTEIEILGKREQFYKNSLSSEEKQLSFKLTNTIDSQLFALRNELAITEAEYLSSKSKNSTNENALKSIELKIDNLKNSISEETNELIKLGISSANPIEFRQSLVDSLIQINGQKTALEARLVETDKVLKIYENQLESLPNKFLEYSRLIREKNISEETYGLMKKKFQESRISEASEIGKIRVIDNAIPNNISSFPPSISLLGLLLIIFTVAGSSVYISLSNFLDSSITRIDYVENLGLSILSVIPSFELDKKQRKKKKIINEYTSRLILNDDSKSPISESYRTLRTSLEFLKNINNTKAKKIIVSSSGPQEGKSTTSANIAIAFASQSKKTIILDCDMRKPILHKAFDVDKDKGISKMFINQKETTFDNNIQSTKIKNLDILCAGPIPPNPSELLSSTKFENALNELFDKYDVVIVDTPPLIAVTDALLLRKHFDELILIVRLKKTEKGALDRSMKNLENIGFPLKYCVLNEVSGSSYYGSYYYSSYHYYYGNDNENN